MRESRDMKPTPLGELQPVMRRLQKFAEILEPKDAEEPILAAPVRAAVYEWLVEISARSELLALNVKPRSSALLYGPPGTGKTTLAHHLSARLGLPLVVVNSERLIDPHLGASSNNVAELFSCLHDVGGNCVILLDEIDSIGARRSNDDQACSRELNAVLNTLLRHVEAFKGVFIAATNRQGSLDPALWRRFGMQIEVALPGADERYAILKRYAAPFDLPEDTADILTDVTRGASPALMRGLMEGIKRSIVLGPRLRRDISKPIDVIAPVIASTQPPPEFEPPLLWSSPQYGLDLLANIEWPLQIPREDAA